MRLGIIAEAQGLHLLQLYGLPVSAGPKVFTGEKPTKKPEKLW